MPCTARSGPIRSQASSSGVRQSAPMTSTARLAHLAENRAGADAEMNRRHVERRERLEDAARVGQDELAVVARVQRADPRVEDLHGVDAGLDLRHQIVARRCRRAGRRSACHAVGAPYISALVCAKLLEWPPSIAYDASVNGAPANPMSGTRPASSGCIMPDRLEHVRERLARLEAPHAREVGLRCAAGARSPGLRPARSRSGCPSARAAAGDRRRGSRRRPRSAAPAAASLGREIGRPAQVEQGVALAQRAVLGACSGRPDA